MVKLFFFFFNATTPSSSPKLYRQIQNIHCRFFFAFLVIMMICPCLIFFYFCYSTAIRSTLKTWMDLVGYSLIGMPSNNRMTIHEKKKWHHDCAVINNSVTQTKQNNKKKRSNTNARSQMWHYCLINIYIRRVFSCIDCSRNSWLYIYRWFQSSDNSFWI